MNCPNESTLQRFLRGELPDEESDRIAAHTDECAICETKVRQMEEQSDSIFDRMGRGTPLPNPTENARAFQQLREKLCDLAAPAMGTGPKNHQARFSARLNCPHCQNAIEIIAESNEAEVNCPACGSSVTIDSTRSLTWNKEHLPQIAHFELLEAVGRGAFGTVYKARDLQLQRIVAIKIPRSGVLETDEDEDRFVREARHAAQLHHPGIVSMHSVGRSETFPYLVSEFVEGVTLSQYLTAKRFNVQDAARLIRDVARALHHAHQSGVVHRDLKPSNIMLGPDGTPRIMDFGCAKRDAGEITMTVDGQILGTPAYMSPEQARGRSHQADARSDIYSLGVVFFQLLTAELPFRGDVRMLLHQVIHDEPPSPRKLNHQVPRDLETICLKCLSKEPHRRFASADELAKDLQRYLDGQPILSRPVSRIERVWRWCRRNPVVASLSTIALLLLTITVVVSTVAYVRESQFALQQTKARENAQKLAETNEKLAEDEKSARETADANARTAAIEAARANSEADNARRKKELAERLLYVAHMNLIQQTWEEGNISRAVELLKRHLPQANDHDLRGFEWYYWWSRCHEYATSIDAHEGDVTCLAFSPDGIWLASGSSDKSLCLWERATDRRQMLFPSNESGVLSVAFSPNGKEFAVGLSDGLVQLWAIDGESKPKLKREVKLEGGPVSSIEFHPHEPWLLCKNNDAILWNLESGFIKVIINELTIPKNSVFSPDGTTIAYTHSLLSRIVISNNARLPDMGSHDYSYRSLTYSPKGRLLVSGHDYPGYQVCIWDNETGALKQSLTSHVNAVDCVAVSPDGEIVASGSRDLTIKLWDVNSGKLRKTLKGHGAQVRCIAFSPDGRFIASGSRDRTIKIWDVTKGELPALIRHTKNETSVYSTAISPDGKTLASAGNLGCVYLSDSLSGKIRIELVGHLHLFARLWFTPNGAILVSAQQSAPTATPLLAWNVENGAPLKILKEVGNRVRPVAFSLDGTRMVTGNLDHSLMLWDLTQIGSGKSADLLGTFPGHESRLYAAAFSRDGKVLASGSADRIVKLWDIETGTLIASLRGHTDEVRSLEFSPDGSELATGSRDTTIKLWDWRNAKLRTTLNGHADSISMVAYSPDGKTLASSSGDTTIKLWDTVVGEVKTTLKGHTKYVWSVAWSTDGQTLFSGAEDQSALIWRGERLNEH